MFTVPTIFTAIDRLSAPLRAMSSSVTKFATKAEAGVARAERVFNKFTPSLSNAGKELLNFVSAAAVAAAVLGGITFGVQALKEYEDAVASFKTIVSDKTEPEFQKYKQSITDVAVATGQSTTNVAKSFEKIAGLNSSFADTPEQLDKISRAVITLSRASGEELGPSAESLVGIMNQFNFSADQADRTINALAAGTAVGASSIAQTAEAFTAFGSVAAGANITLEQSVGLIQTLASKSKFGSDAGNDLKAAIVNLQKANLGYVKGQFTMNAALDQAQKKMSKFKTEQQKNKFLIDTFGKTGINTGQILLNNRDKLEEFTKGVTGTNDAQVQATIKMQTFSNVVDGLKNKFVTWITTSDEAKKGLDLLKRGIRFVTDHLTTIISVVGQTIKWFVIIKTSIFAVKTALMAWRAISNAFFLYDMIKYTASTTGMTFAQSAYAIATQSATGAQLSLNAAMFANPIGVVLLAVLALSAAFLAVIDAYKQLEAIAKKEAEHKKAIKDESFAVQDLEKKYLSLGKSKAEAHKMALVDSKKGAISELKKVSEGLGSADPSVRSQAMDKFNVVSGKAEALMNKDVFSFAGNRFANSEDFKTKALTMNPTPGSSMAPADWLNMPSQKEALNSKEANRQATVNDMVTQTNNAKVDINIKAPDGMADATSNSDFVKIKTTSTMSAAK